MSHRAATTVIKPLGYTSSVLGQIVIQPRRKTPLSDQVFKSQWLDHTVIGVSPWHFSKPSDPDKSDGILAFKHQSLVVGRCSP